jgi:hypothetical protein
MRTKYGLFILVVVALVLSVSAPVVSADPPAPQLPGGITVSQTYVNTLTYWFKANFPQDWQARLAAALNPALAITKNSGLSESVLLNGLPANTWWIDVWHQELNGAWTPQQAIRPAAIVPNPVKVDMAIQGTLPGVIVIRACDKTGMALAGGAKLLVVMPGGGLQGLNVPTLPAATADQVTGLPL